MRVAKRSFLYNRLNSKNFIFNYKDFFIQCLIKKGFKKKARQVFFNFLILLKKKFLLNVSSNDFLKDIFEKKKPCVAFVQRKVASVVYTIPVYIKPDRASCTIVRWFIENASLRSERTLSEKLFFEFLDLQNGVGKTIRKLEEYYKIAVKNRPFTKFIKKRSKRYRAFRRRKFGV
jgi:ribosomal protein S7